jgi:outer membrane protein TolC
VDQGTIPDPLTTWNTGLTLRVPVVAPRAWHDRRTARHAIGVRQLQTEDAERIVLASAAEAIVGVVTAERMAEVSRVSLKSALVTLDLNRRRARLGAASAFDVLRAEQEVAASRAQVVNADEALRLSREALGLTLGSHEPYGVTASINLNGLARDAAASCRAEPSIDLRADVRAAQRSAEVASRNVNSTRWDYFPTVDALSTATYWNDDIRTANGRHVTWTIGATLTWQLYDGGLRYGRRDTNQGQLTLAQEQLTETRRRAQVEVQQARRAVQVAEANLAVSQHTRDLAQKSAHLARFAFLNGTGTSFDLVDAARRLREAELDLAVKEFQVVRAKILALLALASCDV